MFINLGVIYAMRIMLVTQLGASINAKRKYSAIGKQLLEVHGDKNLLNENKFCVRKKCCGKFDCFVYEMLFIKELRPEP